MSGDRDWGREYLIDFYRDQAIDAHEAQKASWGWFGRSQHWMFASWRCPACKAAKARQQFTTSGLHKEK